MEAGLRRYWFVFDVAPFEPNQGPGISLDGPEVWTPEARVRGGVGVTGSDESECLNLVRSRIFLDAPMPPVLRVIEDVDVSTLGEHVLQTMEVPVWRGIWFPRGFGDSPML